MKKEIKIIKLPILAITLGDPCGSGPEITVKACNDKKIYEICRPLIVGDSCVIEKSLKFNTISDIDDAIFTYGTIDVFDIKNISSTESLNMGTPKKQAVRLRFNM